MMGREILFRISLFDPIKKGGIVEGNKSIDPFKLSEWMETFLGFGIFSQLLKQLMVMLPQLKNYGLCHT